MKTVVICDTIASCRARRLAVKGSVHYRQAVETFLKRVGSIGVLVMVFGCHGQSNSSQDALQGHETGCASDAIPTDSNALNADVFGPDSEGFGDGRGQDTWQSDGESDASSHDAKAVVGDALEDSVDSDAMADTSAQLSDTVEQPGPDSNQPWTVEPSEEPIPDIVKSTVAAGPFEEAYPLAQGMWLRGANGDVYIDPIKGIDKTIEGLIGEVLKVEVVGGESNLILTTAGLFAFNGQFVAPSPVASLIQNGPILDVVDASSNKSTKLWLLTASTLYLYRDGDLTAFTSPTVDFGGGMLTYGATYNGMPACWIATSNDALYAAIEDESGVVVWEVLVKAPIDQLASDGEGNLWVRQWDRFYRRSPEATWDAFTFETPLVELSAHRTAWMTWFRLEDALWAHALGDFWKLEQGAAPLFMRAWKKETLTVVESEEVANYTVTSLPVPTVESVTWSGHVEPLSKQACGLCHGEGQFAHEMTSYEQWVDEFEAILVMVETEQMPLAPGSPLTPVEKQMLLDWQLGGFLP